MHRLVISMALNDTPLASRITPAKRNNGLAMIFRVHLRCDLAGFPARIILLDTLLYEISSLVDMLVAVQFGDCC